MSDDAPGVLEATAEVVELSFELVGAEFSMLPEHCPRIISPLVQAAIKKMLAWTKPPPDCASHPPTAAVSG